MRAKDGLLAAIVIWVWGINFIFMHFALNEVSPMVLGVLRFCLILFPAIFFVPKPAVPWYWLIAYGTFLSFGQFSLLFGAIAIGLSTGLAALLLQSQAFFSILMAALLWREQIRPVQWLSMMLAIGGLVCIGIGQQDTQVSIVGLILIVGAAISWSAGNMVVKYIGPTAPLPLVVWGNIISLLLFFAAACWHDGIRQLGQQIMHMNWRGWFAVAYLSYGASFIGYGLWGVLLSRYPTAKVAPLTLLIPVVAIGVAFLFLHERFNGWQWLGVLIVMLSLVVPLVHARLHRQPA